MTDSYIRKIGVGIYITDLAGSQNKIKELKSCLDNYIEMIHEDLEDDFTNLSDIKECNRKIELIVHIIEKLNEFVIRDSCSLA